MNLTLSLAPIVSLIAGILILVVPRLLNYIVAIYLIVIGLLGLFGWLCRFFVRNHVPAAELACNPPKCK